MFATLNGPALGSEFSLLAPAPNAPDPNSAKNCAVLNFPGVDELEVAGLVRVADLLGGPRGVRARRTGEGSPPAAFAP